MRSPEQGGGGTTILLCKWFRCGVWEDSCAPGTQGRVVGRENHPHPLLSPSMHGERSQSSPACCTELLHTRIYCPHGPRWGGTRWLRHPEPFRGGFLGPLPFFSARRDSGGGAARGWSRGRSIHTQAGGLNRSRNEAPQHQQRGPTAPRASEERGHLAGVVGQDADGVLGPAAQQAQHGVLLQRDTAAGGSQAARTLPDSSTPLGKPEPELGPAPDPPIAIGPRRIEFHPPLGPHFPGAHFPAFKQPNGKCAREEGWEAPR